jgi:hypothetical protein
MIDVTFVGGAPSPRPVGPAPRPYVPAGAPSSRTWVYVVAVLALWLATVGALVYWLRPHPTPEPTPPSPVADYDPNFVPVGKRYAAQLGIDWGKSNEDIAKLHDAGQARAAAAGAGAERFKALREASYRSIVNPELEKVVARDAKDDSLTIDDHRKLARAYRGLLKGGEGR